MMSSPSQKRKRQADSPPEHALLTRQSQLIASLTELATCNICLDLLTNPFLLSCGHEACQACLLSWFERPSPSASSDEIPDTYRQRWAKLTCPQCRTAIRQGNPPVQMFNSAAIVSLLREFTASSTSTNDALLPTTVLPNEQQPAVESANTASPSAETTVSEQWALLFPPVAAPHTYHARTGIEDTIDGVFRCDVCAFEIIDGFCSNCGERETNADSIEYSVAYPDSDDEFGRTPYDLDRFYEDDMTDQDSYDDQDMRHSSDDEFLVSDDFHHSAAQSHRHRITSRLPSSAPHSDERPRPHRRRTVPTHISVSSSSDSSHNDDSRGSSSEIVKSARELAADAAEARINASSSNVPEAASRNTSSNRTAEANTNTGPYASGLGVRGRPYNAGSLSPSRSSSEGSHSGNTYSAHNQCEHSEEDEDEEGYVDHDVYLYDHFEDSSDTDHDPWY